MKRAVYQPLGLLCLALGALGLFLPILPSTPFVLLAAWCFARSSERWHAMLLRSRLFGPVIRDWESKRCIALRTKLGAIAMMGLAGGASIAFAIDDPRLQLATAALIGTGMCCLLLIRTCPAGGCGDDRRS